MSKHLNRSLDIAMLLDGLKDIKKRNKGRDKYLGGLDINQLLDFLEDVIRHDHYCPRECRCFERWSYQYNVSEIKEEIIKRIKQ